MGWQERRYDDHEETFGGRVRRAMRRIFVEGDNFFGWGFTLFRVKGIRVRIHLLFVIFIIAELILSLPLGASGLGFRAMLMACLFGMVLLHEFGHCFACRRVGGEANEIMLWPLGGLAMCSPPHDWKANLITTIGGPLVNVMLLPLLAALMLWTGAHFDQLIFNPFAPERALAVLGWGKWWKIAVFYAYYTNLGLLAFNLLLPMFPLDGAKIAQELLWRKIGYRRSMLIAVNVGLVTAIVVAVFGVVSPNSMLLGLALFGGSVCYHQKQRLAVMEDVDYDIGAPAAYGYGPRSPEPAPTSRREESRAFERARRSQESKRDLQAEVDRILGKIKDQGMQSLTRAERRTLEEDTRRKRGDGRTVATED